MKEGRKEERKRKEEGKEKILYMYAWLLKSH